MTSKAVTVRFHLEREADQSAWERLQQIHQREHLSLGRAIIHALNEMSDNDLSSTQQFEMTRQFAESVLAELQKTLPAFISGCVAVNAITVPAGGIMLPIAAQEDQPQTPSLTEPKNEPQPDFSRSHIDWGFSGS